MLMSEIQIPDFFPDKCLTQELFKYSCLSNGTMEQEGSLVTSVKTHQISKTIAITTLTTRLLMMYNNMIYIAS